MSLQPRAVIFAEERSTGFVQILREFLFKMGFRQTVCTTNPTDISNLIHTSHWPIVFVDHTNGVNDGMQMFEGIYKIIGHQLIPYVFTAPSENQIFDSFYQSIGAVGFIKKPLQTSNAEKIIRAVLPQPNDPAIRLAHQVSKAMLQGHYGTIEQQLNRLRDVPQFKRHAEIALLRIEMTQGHMSKANDRFRHLLRDRPRDLRVLSEYAEFLKKNALYFNTMKCYQRIKSLHPELTFKFWDQVTLHIELEQMDEAARMLDSMQHDATYRDLAAEALARMMYFMGLQHNISNFVKLYPSATRNYNMFTGATPPKKVSSS
ncbi:response regulator [bacterium]|nr:response regulator [bacterium]